MAIGRLDEDSEGLLLLTTDGKVSEAISSADIEKEYYAQVDGLISDEALEQLKSGVEIGLKGSNIKHFQVKLNGWMKSQISPQRKKNQNMTGTDQPAGFL